MHTRIQQWGNSLAIRIPRPFADQIGFRKDGEVDLSIHKGIMVVKPLPIPQYTLDELLAGINEENLHQEIDTGAPQGREIW